MQNNHFNMTPSPIYITIYSVHWCFIETERLIHVGQCAFSIFRQYENVKDMYWFYFQCTRKLYDKIRQLLSYRSVDAVGLAADWIENKQIGWQLNELFLFSDISISLSCPFLSPTQQMWTPTYNDVKQIVG